MVDFGPSSLKTHAEWSVPRVSVLLIFGAFSSPTGMFRRVDCIILWRQESQKKEPASSSTPLPPLYGLPRFASALSAQMCSLCAIDEIAVRGEGAWFRWAETLNRTAQEPYKSLLAFYFSLE